MDDKSSGKKVNLLKEMHSDALRKANKVLKSNFHFNVPDYNPDSGILEFMEKEIQIDDNTNQSWISKIIFEDLSQERWWNWDELYEIYDDTGKHRGSHNKIYNACKRLNEQIKKATGVDDLIIVKTYRIKVNPKYLEPSISVTP